jgi:predicted PurR-regulated permease PerM
MQKQKKGKGKSMIKDFAVWIALAVINIAFAVIMIFTQSSIGFGLLLISAMVFISFCIASFFETMPKQVFVVSSIAFAVILFFCYILPYSLQIADACDIDRLNDDIALYNSYVDKYENEDKVVLEEWAKQQADLSKKLSALGIQFAGSIEPNNIIKKLSEKVSGYLNSITDKELEINKVKSEIKARTLNRWFFGL